jgi:hypothetical protein
MALIELSGLDELLDDLLGAADLPAEEMLNAGADVAVEAQRKTGEAMGVHRTGVTLSSIKKLKVVKATSGAFIKIVFDGSNADGNPNSEVAFINEYGKTNQPARPFIAIANEESAGDIAVAEYRVYDAFLKSKNL